jgi:hypothetical protein
LLIRDTTRTFAFLVFIDGDGARNLDTWASNRSIRLDWEDGKIFGKKNPASSIYDSTHA